MRCMIQSTQGDNKQRTASSVNLENIISSSSTNSTLSINIIPQAPIPTQCAVFQFLSEPGIGTRTAFVNYCQKVYSGPGWSNNGCVVCSDSGLTYTTPGLSLPMNVTCMASAAPKAKLRFLQVTTASIAPPNVVANVPASLTVCPIPSPICATDSSGSKNYVDFFNQFTNDLKTAPKIKETLNIDNVFPNTTAFIITVTDLTAPDSTKIVSVVVSSNINGAVSWTNTHPSPIHCYWKISDSTTLPSWGTIKSCADAAWCGGVKVGPVQTTVTTTNLKAFTAGSTYNIYIDCQNDIPFAQKQASVRSAGMFTIPAAVVPPTTTTTNTTTTSANFINVSMFALMIIFALLLN